MKGLEKNLRHMHMHMDIATQWVDSVKIQSYTSWNQNFLITLLVNGVFTLVLGNPLLLALFSAFCF